MPKETPQILESADLNISCIPLFLFFQESQLQKEIVGREDAERNVSGCESFFLPC